MRRWLLIGCAMVALQPLPAGALTTPERMRQDARGDDRVRQVWWRPGVVIELAGAEGKSLLVEMPKGMDMNSFMLSEQQIIKPDDLIEIDPTTGKAIESGKVVNKEDGCTATINLKICVRRERFLFFVPYVTLDRQPLPMLMIEKKKVGRKGKESIEEIEHSIIFELSTVPENERPYYGVKVLVGDPPAPAADPLPPVAGPAVSRETPPQTPLPQPPAYRPVVTIPAKPGMPKADRERLRQLERAPTPPIETNSKYIIQGDTNLIGR